MGICQSPFPDKSDLVNKLKTARYPSVTWQGLNGISFFGGAFCENASDFYKEKKVRIFLFYVNVKRTKTTLNS